MYKLLWVVIILVLLNMVMFSSCVTHEKIMTERQYQRIKKKEYVERHRRDGFYLHDMRNKHYYKKQYRKKYKHK